MGGQGQIEREGGGTERRRKCRSERKRGGRGGGTNRVGEIKVHVITPTYII